MFAVVWPKIGWADYPEARNTCCLSARVSTISGRGRKCRFDPWRRPLYSPASSWHQSVFSYALMSPCPGLARVATQPSARSLPRPNRLLRPSASSRSPRFRRAKRLRAARALPPPCRAPLAPCRLPAACVRGSFACPSPPWPPRARDAGAPVRTLEPLGRTSSFPLRGLPEPRIEPEIVFGLARAPEPEMDDVALLACVDWVAHGFEIVQSMFPGWRFSAADIVAACGAHGGLLVGPRHCIGTCATEWRKTLCSFRINLLCNGRVVDEGGGANVLDGPVSAVRELVAVLACTD